MLVNSHQWGFISTPFVPPANGKFQTLACETRRLQGTLAFNEKSLRQLGKKISFPHDTEEAKIKWTFHSFQPTSDFSRRKNIDNESSFFYFFPERGEMSNRVIGEISLACLLLVKTLQKVGSLFRFTWVIFVTGSNYGTTGIRKQLDGTTYPWKRVASNIQQCCHLSAVRTWKTQVTGTENCPLKLACPLCQLVFLSYIYKY